MNMNNTALHYQILEAPLVIKRFVANDPACNYEKYLIEFINASTWFAKKFDTPFISPESEESGQCDANSGMYGLDFKLIASKTKLQAKSIFSFQIVKMTDGAYAYCQPKSNGNMKTTRFPQAIRGLTIDKILEMCSRSSRKQGVENDVNEYMCTLDTNKNLLLFFPYRFDYEKKGELTDDVLSVIEQCNEDFCVTLEYRAQRYPALDTFFAFLYDYYFIFCKWTGERLAFLEAVPVEQSKTFMYLALTYCDNWAEKYDVTLQEMRKKEKT